MKDEQDFGVPKVPTGKAGDYCWLLATAVWTLAWLAAASVAVAHVVEVIDGAALGGLAVAVLMAGIGCLAVLHFVRCCLQHPQACADASCADSAAQSKDQMQAKEHSSPSPETGRIIDPILRRFFTIIWCGVAIVWNVGCYFAMLHSASHGRAWFMLMLIPFSLVGLMLLLGLFAALAAVIEFLVRIL